jgi:hypothetical protein
LPGTTDRTKPATDAAQSSDRGRDELGPATNLRAARMRRSNQGALAAAVRALSSSRGPRPMR